MLETLEIVQTVDHLNKAFDDLILRGLRSAGQEDLNLLTMLREEFERIGAHHLSKLVATIVDGIKADDPRTAAYLFRAQASLRVFERILTLDSVGDSLQVLGASAMTDDNDDADGDGDGDGEEEEEDDENEEHDDDDF